MSGRNTNYTIQAQGQQGRRIYNYLGIAYQRVNQQKEYFSPLVETREKFPDYLFGKISISKYYLSKEEFRKIPGLIDNKFEITQHYPKETKIQLVHATIIVGVRPECA